jgi:mRNA interferase MazF
LSNTKIILPRRGEIWLVDFEPTVGSEIQKKRPDAFRSLPLRLVVPIKSWKDKYSSSMWLIRIDPDDTNGLDKISAIDALQIRSVDINRFQKRIGRAPENLMEEIKAAIAVVIEYS